MALQSLLLRQLPEPSGISDRERRTPKRLSPQVGNAKLPVNGLTMPLRELIHVSHPQALQQPLSVDNPATFSRPGQLVPGAMCPFRRMTDHTGTHHVQVNVEQASRQMSPVLNPGCMVSVIPEGTRFFALEVVELPHHAMKITESFRYLRSLPGRYQQMDMVTGDDVVQDIHPVAPRSLEKMADIEIPVFLKSEQEFLSVAAVGDVVAGTRRPDSFFSCHRLEILIFIFFG
jgi:hypothetical protein